MKEGGEGGGGEKEERRRRDRCEEKAKGTGVTGDLIDSGQCWRLYDRTNGESDFEDALSRQKFI